MSYLHLNDNESQPTRGSPHYDKLYKVRPYLDTLVRNFRKAYTPQQNLSINESIISYKGRPWIQYMPKKPTKWGMKAWCLADSNNGYIWNLKIYTGKTCLLTHTCIVIRNNYNQSKILTRVQIKITMNKQNTIL